MSNDFFTVAIAAEQALQLFYDCKINLCATWPQGQALRFLHEILETPYSELLRIIDHRDYSEPLETEYIPQFADVSEIDNVVQILATCGEESLSYPDLGYYLIRSERKHSAYAKYGENYGKGTALLGLACYDPGTIRCSVLSDAYMSITDEKIRAALRCKLFLRIPLIQELLYRAKETQYNGYDSMRMFSLTTMRRRGQSPRKLFSELQKCGDQHINQRIQNIFWEE